MLVCNFSRGGGGFVIQGSFLCGGFKGVALEVKHEKASK